MRIGRRAVARVRAGGKLAVGRPSATLVGWRATVARVGERANWRCERCGSRRALDPHHVQKRSQGGPDDPGNVVLLCRWECHRLCDAPFRDGRLLVSRLGHGRFCFLLVVAEHKGAPGMVSAHDHTPTPAWLAAQGRPVTAQRGFAACPVRAQYP
jgi:hypothetical protein